MDKVIRLYKIVDGVETPFPNEDNPMVTSDFTYSAQRMGGAPIITCVLHSGESIESWGDGVYAYFNEEKFTLRQTPTSSFNNTNARYRYEAELVSERRVLESTLFYDVVIDADDSETTDVAYITRNTHFEFFGTILEFVQRLNASMIISELPFRVSVDEGVITDGKMISIEDRYLVDAFQEIYNTYELPYYYDASSKTFIVGHNKSTIIDEDNNEVVFEYGSDKSLIDITKTNAKHKLINRITGYGSADNIPSYYPNETSKGAVVLTTSDSLQGKVFVSNKPLFARMVDLNEKVHFKLLASSRNSVEEFYQWQGNIFVDGTIEYWDPISYYISPDGVKVERQKESFKGCTGWSIRALQQPDKNGTMVRYETDGARIIQNYKLRFDVVIDNGVGANVRVKLGIPDLFKTYLNCGLLSGAMIGYNTKVTQTYQGETIELPVQRSETNSEVYLDFTVLYDEHDTTGEGYMETVLTFQCYVIGGQMTYTVGGSTVTRKEDGSFIYSAGWTGWLKMNFEIANQEDLYGWAGKHLTSVDITKYGLQYAEGFNPVEQPTEWVDKGLWFGLERDEDIPYITPQPNLMPAKYRETDGAERFYNAINDTYIIPEDYGGGIKDEEPLKYTFALPFEGQPKEHIQSFEDIKPTIHGVKNATDRLPINTFLVVAFDEDDNDEVDENGKYIHPYFYVKLRKFDGTDGFNLFEQQIDEAEMQLSMLDGLCGGCKFVIGVTPNTQKNPVQVFTGSDGVVHLLRDKAGTVVHGTPQPQQNNTKENEVWIALRKDTESFSQLMPNRTQKLLPKEGDSFVILHIDLPLGYITAAEKRLEEELIEYMHKNNMEKFTFSIKFSRVYLAEHPKVLQSLNENASIKVRYEGKDYLLYATSYTYRMTNNDLIPEINVDVADTLVVNQSAIEEAVAPLRADLANSVRTINILERGAPYFLRKDVNDVAKGSIHFTNGATIDKSFNSSDFSENSRGMGLYKDTSGLWHIESDYLRVRKEMFVESLEVATTTAENGAKYLTAASNTIHFVVEQDESYRCFFLKTSSRGNLIQNFWKVGDQAYHKTFNLATKDVEELQPTMRDYWRRVVAVSTGTEEGSLTVNNTVYHLSEYHFVDLSKTNCAADSDIPQIGDVIVQLGYQEKDDPSRQNAIVLAGAGDDSPYIQQFVGINSFTLPDPETQIKPNDNILTGRVVFQQGSSGLENLSEWSKKQQQIDSATSAAATAQTNAQTAQQLAAATQSIANAAKSEAEEAKKEATDAKSEAQSATQQLDSWLEDGVISPVEKQSIKTTLAQVNAEYTDDTANCKRYNIEYSTHTPLYNTYVNELTKLLSITEATSSEEVKEAQDAYYESRIELLSLISSAAKTNADNAQKTADEAQATADEAQSLAITANSATTNLTTRIDGVDATIEEINKKLDGVVDNYFGKEVPTTSNYPANEWTTDEAKANHVGDTYTNTSTIDEDADNGGKSWRWLASSTSPVTYSWQLIADTDAIKALAMASQAQAAADGKIRTFLTTPTPPYDKGDLWVGGETNPLRVCINSKAKGDYVETDWALADNTQTLVNELRETLQSEVNAQVTTLNSAIADAEKASKEYTQEESAVLQEMINVLNEAKASVTDVYTKADADKQITDAEANAIFTANEAASKALKLYDEAQQAMADGVITEEEQERIAGAYAAWEKANKKAQEAAKAAEEEAKAHTNASISNLRAGLSNLVRNSGFTGDYSTSILGEGSSLNEIFETYSPSLEHWTYRAVTAEESTYSQSGKEANMVGGGELSQEIYHPVKADEEYILSFNAKGGTLVVSFNGQEQTVSLQPSTWTKQVLRYTTQSVGGEVNKMLRFYSSSNTRICDIMLDAGNIVSEWTPSPLDNITALAKYEEMTYLQQALKVKKTIVEGGTVTTGLLNAVLIEMGNVNDNGVLQETTAGVSGVYNDANSVAFFGGGDLAKAIYTVQKYKDNPNYEPTTEELASMAKAVITHGGRAILQDIILRGYVYAEGGVFNGTVNATDGVFNGTVYATDGVFNGTMRANLIFNKTKIITEDNYTISPQSEPYGYYIYQRKLTAEHEGTILRLPTPEEGLEITLYVFNTGIVLPYHVVIAPEGSYVVYRMNIAYVTAINGVDYPVEILNGEVQERHSVTLQSNGTYRFRAINGNWVALDGIFTGE